MSNDVKGSLIDVMLTNKPISFYNTTTIETGLGDHHKLMITFLRCHYQCKIPAKNIVKISRGYKKIAFQGLGYVAQ